MTLRSQGLADRPSLAGFAGPEIEHSMRLGFLVGMFRTFGGSVGGPLHEALTSHNIHVDFGNPLQM